jgi:hypothetical protein
MPTILTLSYTAYVEIKVPNKIARLLKERQPDSLQEHGDGAFAFGNKWGNLFFQGADGEEYKIAGETREIDYKRTDEGWWEDEEDSDEEDEDDITITQKKENGEEVEVSVADVLAVPVSDESKDE